jgi:hypothetical protein
MGKSKRVVIKLFIIIFSLCFVDGGRSFSFLGDKIQILLAQDHSNDNEIPNQQHTCNLNEEEKWMDSFSFDFFCIALNSVKFIYSSQLALQDYSDSIWQPPKFV